MKKVNRLLSVILAVIMVLGTLTVAPLTVGAAATQTQLSAYKNKLRVIHDNPSDYMYVDRYSDIEKCKFAIADVTADGTDDLIAYFNNTIVASIHSEIWTLNSSNQVVSLGNYGFEPEFYKNGYMVNLASHNQGPSASIWPYYVSSYNKNTKKFDKIFSAYSIDKDYCKNGEFDASLDLDKDGVIYVVNGEYLTKKEYDAYVNRYIPSKNKINIKWKYITNSNIDNLVTASSVSLNRSTLTLGVGEKYSLKRTITPSAANQSCTWSSSNKSVATVDSTGKITAKKSGTANITVKTSNGKTATCKVTVKPAPKSVKTNPTSLTLGVGESYTISENTNSGSYANAANLKWSTSNSGVASVAKGSANKATIKAKKTGTANVTIKLYNGKTATCKVTVKPAPKSLKLSQSSVTLGVGESYTISENTNSGSYANAANLKWSSSNSGVASVAKGSANKATIKAKKTGTANVTIKLYNGKTATCKVTVKPAPKSLKLSQSSVTLGVGESYTIRENTNSGSYANAANLKWSSSNSGVASVAKGSANKATIKAKKTGTANVTIKLYNGKTATCKVTVKPAPKSVKLSKSSITLNVGKSYTISESTNSGSYANSANLKWSSSNSSVATVKKGSANKATITAKKAGTTTITIKLYNGKTATCKVTVTKKVEGIPNHNGISSVEQSIFKDMNKARKKEGKAALKWDSELYPGAKIRANEHAYWATDGNQSYYAHNRPNGDYYWTVFEETGLGWSPWTTDGENLAIGNNENELFEDWMNSPPHREAILDVEFTHVAICVIEHENFYYACALFHGPKLEY